MRYLSVKNLDKYQHYKDRDPKWIKLYYSILDDEAFIFMDEAMRCRYITCLILASRSNNKIPADPQYLKKVMRLDKAPDLQPLIDSGRLIYTDDIQSLDKCTSALTPSPLLSSPLSSTTSLSLPESEIHLKSNDYTEDFEKFWASYPRKVGKIAAFKVWRKSTGLPEMVQIIRVIEESKRSEQWTKENGNYIPHPTTWLNEGRWSDEPTAKPITTLEAFLNRKDHDESLRVR